ncbi:LPAR6 protein, partial [Mystacornis crossleyi]|nr:LPAR6 protein [Mystacornis crossleyi]
MAGVPWAQGVSGGTNFPGPNGTNAGSGADLQHSLLAVTYGAVVVLGLLGNALALPLLSCRAKPLSHSYILLLQLALLDALFLGVLPLQVHSQLRGDTWAFGAAACAVAGALSGLHLSLSVAFFSCLCADVWLAVLHPFASIRLRATHYVLVATALWVVALGAAVPPALRGGGGGARSSTACFESFPGSWAQPTAPHTILAFIFGVLVPFAIILLGFPLVARSIWQSRRRAAKRKALGTVCIILGICALCFLPHQLSQLLRFLLGIRAIQGEPLPSLIPEIQRVTSALASCSCCLNPLLYYFHSSSRHWHCPCRLRLRSKRVFTICDQNFGDPSWDYRPGQRRGRKSHGDGIN